MKYSKCSAPLFVCMLVCLGIGSSAMGQEKSHAELARQIVTASAGVKPGDVVVIAGGKHNVGLMEDLAIEAAKAGGMVTMWLDSDKLQRAIYTQVPEKYLEQQPAHIAEWLKHMNVFIGLPGVEDAKAVYGDVPQARLAKANKADQVITDALNASGVRAVFLGYPSPSQAEVNQLDFATYQKVFLDAVSADYHQISADGSKLKALLEQAKTVHITAPSGTDLTFSLGKRPIFLDDGLMTPEKVKSHLAMTRFVSLPGGTISLAPVETSANGKVVIPRDQCQFKPLTGASFELKNGHLENYKANSGGDCFAETLAPYHGPKDVFAFFQIGLNREAKVMEDPGDFRPYYAAGLVTIGIGDNEIIGGSNRVEGGGGANFPIVNATVTVDGKTVVRDGKLEL